MFSYYPAFLLERLRKTMQSSNRIPGNPAKIRTRYRQNIRPEHYQHTNLLGRLSALHRKLHARKRFWFSSADVMQPSKWVQHAASR